MKAKSEKHAKELAKEEFGCDVSSYVKRNTVKCDCGESTDITFFPINNDDEREVSFTICEHCYKQ